MMQGTLNGVSKWHWEGREARKESRPEQAPGRAKPCGDLWGQCRPGLRVVPEESGNVFLHQLQPAMAQGLPTGPLLPAAGRALRRPQKAAPRGQRHGEVSPGTARTGCRRLPPSGLSSCLHSSPFLARNLRLLRSSPHASI